ncbi:MAG: hypothetical protein LBC20_16380 [Planctomycetaceae bacterium]|jgi:hypothetical protein|nr:hypothetical protein [Planctomycetaceae bacterium]
MLVIGVVWCFGGDVSEKYKYRLPLDDMPFLCYQYGSNKNQSNNLPELLFLLIGDKMVIRFIFATFTSRLKEEIIPAIKPLFPFFIIIKEII